MMVRRGEREKKQTERGRNEKSLNTHSSTDISIFRRFPSSGRNEGINTARAPGEIFTCLFTQIKRFAFTRSIIKKRKKGKKGK